MASFIPVSPFQAKMLITLNRDITVGLHTSPPLPASHSLCFLRDWVGEACMLASEAKALLLFTVKTAVLSISFFEPGILELFNI